MKVIHKILVLGVILTSGCRSVTATKTNVVGTSSNIVRLTLVNSDDTSMLLPGVELSFIAGDGSVHHLGRTGQFGEISVPKDILRSKSATVVLCCHPLFFCGAIRVREQQLLDYDEYLIALSPIVVR